MYIIDRMMSEAMRQWSVGEYKESLVLSLLGIAAVSKLYYPKKRDRDAYETYLSDKRAEIISRYLGDTPVPIGITSPIINGQSFEEILYKTLRCNIVHELVWPDHVKLKAPEEMSAPIEVYEDGTVVFWNKLPLALMEIVRYDLKVKELRISGQMENAHSPQ